MLPPMPLKNPGSSKGGQLASSSSDSNASTMSSNSASSVGQLDARSLHTIPARSTPGSIASSLPSWLHDGRCAIDDDIEESSSILGPRGVVSKSWTLDAKHDACPAFTVHINLCGSGDEQYYMVFAVLPSYSSPLPLNQQPLYVRSKWGWLMDARQAALNALHISHKVANYSDPDTKMMFGAQWVIFTTQASSRKRVTLQFVPVTKGSTEQTARKKVVTFQHLCDLLTNSSQSSNKSVNIHADKLLSWIMDDSDGKHVYVTAALHAVGNNNDGTGCHRLTVHVKLIMSGVGVHVTMHLDCTVDRDKAETLTIPITTLGADGVDGSVFLSEISLWINHRPLSVRELTKGLQTWLQSNSKHKRGNKQFKHTRRVVFCVAKILQIHHEYGKWRHMTLDIGDKMAKLCLGAAPSIASVAAQRLRTACVPIAVDLQEGQLVVIMLHAPQGRVRIHGTTIVTNARVLLACSQSTLEKGKEAVVIPSETPFGTELDFGQDVNKQRKPVSKNDVKKLWSGGRERDKERHSA